MNIDQINEIEVAIVNELSPFLCEDEVYSMAQQMGVSKEIALDIVANLTGNTTYNPRR
jgi:hypothetical protein